MIWPVPYNSFTCPVETFSKSPEFLGNFAKRICVLCSGLGKRNWAPICRVDSIFEIILLGTLAPLIIFNNRLMNVSPSLPNIACVHVGSFTASSR